MVFAAFWLRKDRSKVSKRALRAGQLRGSHRGTRCYSRKKVPIFVNMTALFWVSKGNPAQSCLGTGTTLFAPKGGLCALPWCDMGEGRAVVDLGVAHAIYMG